MNYASLLSGSFYALFHFALKGGYQSKNAKKKDQGKKFRPIHIDPL